MNKTSQDFAEKLYDILEDQNNQKIIKWNDCGESFLLIDTLEFTRITLEQYFKHKNLNSFIRQLNKYDFHKVKSSEDILRIYGEGVWEFKHAFFKKRRRDLLCKITRKKTISEKREEFTDLNVDVAEKSIFLQNQMLNSLKQLSAHFQALTQDILELKRAIFGDKSSPYSNNTALVYEECSLLKQPLTAILQKNGFSVLCTDSPTELSVSIHEKKFDLLVLSSALRNYVPMIINIKKNDPNIIIVLTGNGFERNELVEFQRIGVDDIVLKPFNDNSFYKVMRKIAKKNCYSTENAERNNFYVN